VHFRDLRSIRNAQNEALQSNNRVNTANENVVLAVEALDIALPSWSGESAII
jgi:hypothetical protein